MVLRAECKDLTNFIKMERWHNGRNIEKNSLIYQQEWIKSK